MLPKHFRLIQIWVTDSYFLINSLSYSGILCIEFSGSEFISDAEFGLVSPLIFWVEARAAFFTEEIRGILQRIWSEFS